MASGHEHNKSKRRTSKDEERASIRSSTRKEEDGDEETIKWRESPKPEEKQNEQTENERVSSPTKVEDQQTNSEDPKEEDAHTKDQEHHDHQQSEPEDDDPENFDSKSFLSSVSDLSVKLQADNLKHVDEDFPADDLKDMVHSVTSVMNNFQNYATHTQKQLEGVREQMREIKDRVYKRIQAKGYDPKSAQEKKSFEERELDAKLAQLNKEIAKAAEELVRASQVSLETETAAIEASLVAERAAEDARRVQEEYEARRLAEIETRKAEEEKREAERIRREEEERKQEEIRKVEDARTSRLKKQDENRTAEWENWPTFTYNVETNDYNQGVGCIIRGDPANFKENMVAVDSMNPLSMKSLLAEHEELVGDVLALKPAHDDEKIVKPIYVAIPHCMTRASALSREPIIKAEEAEGKWVELKSQEVTLEGYKDLKFFQAEVKTFSNICIVSRYKRNYLHLSRKASKCSSNVDPRVTFTAERGTFKANEDFVLQLQPIDSATISRVKDRLRDGKNLLTSSAIVNMEWTSRSFENPVTMTLPCPPNPVKAKKAAAARAAKEAKMKNPGNPRPAFGDDEPKKKVEKKKQNTKQKQSTDDDDDIKRPATAIKFYMGQYGDNEDDENDLLFFLRRSPNGKWQTIESMAIVQAKLDLVQFQLPEPIPTFMVIRTRTSVDAREAQCLADTIELCLKERVVGVILRQKLDNPCDVLLNVVATSKVDKVLKGLEEDGFESENNQNTNDVVEKVLNEGDTLEVCFRGNISNVDNTNLEFIFNSQMQSHLNFSILEVNKYLQRGFPSYRGFVQLVKKTTIVHMPTKKEESEGDAEPRIEIKRDVVSEHMVKIPKEDDSGPPVVVKAPVVIKNESHCLDDETLHLIAQSLGDEWTNVAHYLNVRRQRIQAIMRNNNSGEDEAAKYDMLLTWLKKVPRSQNKVDILSSALSSSNRPDLANDLKNIELEFQAKRRSGSGKVARFASQTSLRSKRSNSAASVRAEEY